MGTETDTGSQRKRTLEALERRFAVATAELLQQQNKTHKRQRYNAEDRKENSKNTTRSSIASPPNLSAEPLTPSLNSLSKRDLEDNGPAYLQLSHSVDDNLLTTNSKFENKKGGMVDMILHELLQHGDSAVKYLQGSRSKKLDNWILLDNFVQGRSKSTNSNTRALQAHSRRSKRRMSMKQHKKTGLFDFPQDLYKFDSFKPMHEMWKAYASQLFQNTGKNQLVLEKCFLGADLHGATIFVADCKSTSFVGVNGIMVCETAETFVIVTLEDKFRVVPKRSSVFMFQVDRWEITLHGDKLISRNLGL